jgi:ATP adenylyltransferase
MLRLSETNCPFCSIDPSSVVTGNELVFAIRDAYPLTPLHTLVLPRRHVSGYFDLYLPEMMGIDEVLRQLRNDIAKTDHTVQGYNVAINIGTVAGQTIHHCHVHLIPRRSGDVRSSGRHPRDHSGEDTLSKLGLTSTNCPTCLTPQAFWRDPGD